MQLNAQNILSQNLFQNYISAMFYMQSLQNEAVRMSRLAPVQVIINDEAEKNVEDDTVTFNDDNDKTISIQSQKASEKSTLEDQPKVVSFGSKFSSFRKKEKIQRKVEKATRSKYIFNTVTSRKKEKKSIKTKMNKIISRVHNMDCLLKKIKAKYLKYLFNLIKDDLSSINIEMKKFDQCAEVRNLNVAHNRDNFIDLTIMQMLLNNGIISNEDVGNILTYGNEKVVSLLNKKVKNQYQFEFLVSKYYRNWIRDPIKINEHEKVKTNFVNKNCLKFPNHSKNIFKRNKEDYEIYIKLLMHTSCNFVFYFQNNPLKFGKKAKENV